MVTNRDDVGIAIRSAFLRKETKQKFSLVALILTCFIFLYLDSFETKPLNLLRSFIKDVIYRGSTFVSLPGKGLNYSLQEVRSHFGLLKENTQLKEENYKLKTSLYKQSFLELENQELKKLLDQESLSSSDLKNAKVIIDKNSPFLKSVIINKGSREKIKKGMAVLSGNNFIGRIVEVNFFSSRVLLITDLNSKIPVVIEPQGYQAILSGKTSGDPVLDYLPKTHSIVMGSAVYTSGKDGIFSPGIPIGETKLSKEKILVSLYSDIHQLSFVNVVMGDFNLGNVKR